MKKGRSEKAVWILGGLLVVSLISVAIGTAKMLGYDPGARPPHGLVGEQAPSLELPLIAGEGQGDRVSLAHLRGRVVLLDFWASWCAPCRRAIPILNQVHARFGDRIAMYGVNVDTGLAPASIRAAHRSFRAQFPSLGDSALATQTAYEVVSIPTLVLIDAEGIIRWVDRGIPDADEVAEHIEVLLEP